jgi:hypothetical protein
VARDGVAALQAGVDDHDLGLVVHVAPLDLDPAGRHRRSLDLPFPRVVTRSTGCVAESAGR